MDSYIKEFKTDMAQCIILSGLLLDTVPQCGIVHADIYGTIISALQAIASAFIV
jgi:hypothetical protein